MNSMFQKNLAKLTKHFTQRDIAEKTGVSQSSINNYLTKSSEPSIQFLIALRNVFGISVDDFLFSDIEISEPFLYDRFIGNYLIYYYNNDSYKGEVHTNLENTLNYGVLSIYEDKSMDKTVQVVALFTGKRVEALKFLKEINQDKEHLLDHYNQAGAHYSGNISATDLSLFIELFNKNNGDKCSIMLNNPPTKRDYLGGAGTANSISRGREHNPCIQFVILSRRELDVPDGEVYDLLHFCDFSADMDDSIKDIIDLFKRLYLEKTSIATELNDNQKQAIIQNKLEYHFNDMLEANLFRFAKVSNKDDDAIYKLIKESRDV